MSWIGVDLDGTLAHYDEWRGLEHIGAPIPKMVARVKDFLKKGARVKIFTARAAEGDEAIAPIKAWCREHLGVVLPVTCIKDMAMVRLYDDRAVQVIPNTGEIVTP